MIKTFIFVEEGSIDIQQLQEDVGDDVHIIVYRQGATKPIIEQPAEPVKDCFDCQDAHVFKPTQKALNEVLSKCKISKKVRKILEELYNDYYDLCNDYYGV